MKKTSVFLVFLAAFAASCSSTKVIDAPAPTESYLPIMDKPLPSRISIPVNILLEDLVQQLNLELGGKALFEDFSYDDNGGDGLMLNAWKSQNITLFASGNTIKYRVPVRLWMKKKLFFGEAEADGELALGFKTVYQVNSDWTLSTKTEVEYHEWLQSPKLKTGLGNIGIETLSNLALNYSKKSLAKKLDELINQQFSIREYVAQAWKSVQDPVLLSPEYKLWLKTTPLKLGMTPLITDAGTLRTKIQVECINDLSFGEKPIFRPNTQVPELTILNDTGDDFNMQFATDIPFPEAERIAKGMMLGQVLESGGKKVTVEDLRIWGNNDKLVVMAQLIGSFKGKVYFMGVPKFNADKNAVEVADLDFHLDSKNLLYKSAGWIFQGPIRQKMAAAMSFPLDENIQSIKQTVQSTLNRYELAKGVVLSGQLEELKVTDTRLTPSGIRVDVFSSGKVRVNVSK